ncbi:MAG TPA: delta-aminolevulinic acid dehydratase [Blastocatellia bacterium]|nr:delta-aminolevulinic acid dehydratase [Blastocatellia bacterium]
MQNSFEQALSDLFEWCRARNFAGDDPFDALNSRIFQATPFARSETPRLVWTQLIKRSPVNLRRLAHVPAQTNPKGIALFALAALANYRRLKTTEAESEARDLIDELLDQRIRGYSGAAWGYNFDWQSRHFFAPRGTPMIVPTAFAARALLQATATFQDQSYLKIARTSCDFILRDLKRTVDTEDELCFSYSPIDQTCVFNASLLAAETLAGVGAITGEAELCDFAVRAARYVVKRQRDDGAWAYGAAKNQGWVDNFHTAYVMQSLSLITKTCGAADASMFGAALQRGYQFWRDRFFLADGWPKYYDDALYPADTHSGAAAIVTLLELRHLDQGAQSLAEKIAAWLLNNMRDSRGFFYYQRRRFYTQKTPFMRWTQAWTAYALARLLEDLGNAKPGL